MISSDVKCLNFEKMLHWLIIAKISSIMISNVECNRPNTLFRVFDYDNGYTLLRVRFTC